MLKIFLYAITILIIPTQIYAFDVFKKGQHSLEFHGYLRHTSGISNGGKTPARFQLPGARARNRLGNEPDSNIELEFDYKYQLQNTDNHNTNIEAVVMLAGFENRGDGQAFELDDISQAYLKLNNLFNNGVDMWVGRRYYQRKAIHILNHFWLNPGQNSHIGVGVEKISLGAGKLDVAFFKNKNRFSLNSNSHKIDSFVVDARWHDLSIANNTTLTAWGQIAQRNALSELDYNKENGFALGGWVDYKSGKITNTTALLYQNSAAITQSGFTPFAVREDQGWNLDNANVFEINNALTYEATPHYSFQWSLVYRQEDRGTIGSSKVTWYNTGIRPVFYLNKHISLIFDTGIDYVKDEVNNRSGSLRKFTTAIQLSPNRRFISRPLVRVYATAAAWSDDFRGIVGTIPGDAPFGDNTSGKTVGIHIESTW